MLGGNQSWGTGSEIEYLRRDCGRSLVMPRFSRLQHLKRYKEAMALRVDWGTIKPGEVKTAVNKLIDIESQRTKELTGGR